MMMVRKKMGTMNWGDDTNRGKGREQIDNASAPASKYGLGFVEFEAGRGWKQMENLKTGEIESGVGIWVIYHDSVEFVHLPNHVDGVCENNGCGKEYSILYCESGKSIDREN